MNIKFNFLISNEQFISKNENVRKINVVSGNSEKNPSFLEKIQKKTERDFSIDRENNSIKEGNNIEKKIISFYENFSYGNSTIEENFFKKYLVEENNSFVEMNNENFEKNIKEVFDKLMKSFDFEEIKKEEIKKSDNTLILLENFQETITKIKEMFFENDLNQNIQYKNNNFNIINLEKETLIDKLDKNLIKNNFQVFSTKEKLFINFISKKLINFIEKEVDVTNLKIENLEIKEDKIENIIFNLYKDAKVGDFEEKLVSETKISEVELIEDIIYFSKKIINEETKSNDLLVNFSGNVEIENIKKELVVKIKLLEEMIVEKNNTFSNHKNGELKIDKKDDIIIQLLERLFSEENYVVSNQEQKKDVIEEEFFEVVQLLEELISKENNVIPIQKENDLKNVEKELIETVQLLEKFIHKESFVVLNQEKNVEFENDKKELMITIKLFKEMISEKNQGKNVFTKEISKETETVIREIKHTIDKLIILKDVTTLPSEGEQSILRETKKTFDNLSLSELHKMKDFFSKLEESFKLNEVELGVSSENNNVDNKNQKEVISNFTNFLETQTNNKGISERMTILPNEKEVFPKENLKANLTNKIKEIQSVIINQDKLLVKLNPMHLGEIDLFFKKTQKGIEVFAEFEKKVVKKELEFVFEELRREYREKGLNLTFDLRERQDNDKEQKNNQEQRGKNEYLDNEDSIEESEGVDFKTLFEKLLR